MPARRREAIVASVCRVLHGRRVPGDAWGLDGSWDLVLVCQVHVYKRLLVNFGSVLFFRSCMCSICLSTYRLILSPDNSANKMLG